MSELNTIIEVALRGHHFRTDIPYTLCVTGGRKYKDYLFVESALDILTSMCTIDNVMSGGAAGADYLFEEYFKDQGYDPIMFLADWDAYGNAAGPIRNADMVSYNPDIVIAFPGGNGTNDMVTKSLAAGILVIDLRLQG